MPDWAEKDAKLGGPVPFSILVSCDSSCVELPEKRHLGHVGAGGQGGGKGPAMALWQEEWRGSHHRLPSPRVTQARIGTIAGIVVYAALDR
jgi:hypothetical protein